MSFSTRNRGIPRQNYEAVLATCSHVATEEFRVAQAAFRGVQLVVASVQKQISSVLERSRGNGDAVGDVRDRLQQLTVKLRQVIDQTLVTTEQSLEQKRMRLEKFTVTLFGRTMAGKSTIREAITRGDGNTIGKGSQRTTRDIREYEWDHLRVIDTPGIGAYEGATDRDLALSVVDQSDLILFLASSDGIQEEAFRGMHALREQNKPIIFVLNVKEDLTRPVYRKRFLRDPGALFDDTLIRGHFRRIYTLAQDFLGMRHITIVPLHAQAAFLATQAADPGAAQELHTASRIEDLLKVLKMEVSQRGPIRRLQTILDGTILALTTFEDTLRDEAKAVKDRVAYLRDKFAELDKWLDGYIGESKTRLEQEAVTKLFALKSSVSQFVDDNIERKDVSERWRQKVEGLRLNEWMGRVQQTVLDEVRGRLEEFNREMEIESSLFQSFDMQGPETYDPWDVRKTLRWTSAGAAALAGVAEIALLIAGTNFWNPVGWLAAASLVALGLSWFFKDRETKLQREKVRATEQLRKQVEVMERRVANELKRWFYGNITSRLVRGIRQDTRLLCQGMFDVVRTLEEGANTVSAGTEELNRRMLIRVGEFVNASINKHAIQKIARDPGFRIKLLWSDSSADERFCSLIGRVIGERIDGIVQGSWQEMVAQALAPAKISAEMVTVSRGTATVKAPPNEMGKALGKNGNNVSLAERLLEMRIKLVRESGNE